MEKFPFEALVVGCGLSGSVVARFLAEEKKKRVLVIDRREHIAGNMYDFWYEDAFLVQKYGPHTFHTNKKSLFDYMRKYADWKPYKLTCMAQIDGKFTPSPFNFQTIDDFYLPEEANKLKAQIKEFYGGSDSTTIVELLKCPNPMVKQFAQFLFDKDYSLYTAKQWGISPSEIDVSVLKRVPVRFSYKSGYFDDEFQVMPEISFTNFFEALLRHENISIKLNTDAKSILKLDDGKVLIYGQEIKIPIIYTGALDELFGYCYGELPYRSLEFKYKLIGCDSYQDAPVVAYPQAKGYTRITEYTKLPVQKTNGRTVIVEEYSVPYSPESGSEPYYPILTEKSQEKYKCYQEECKKYPNIYICGRLADYKYYNMDQALEKALALCEKLHTV